MYRIPLDRAEVEEALTELGYRYRPDPMGRINQGYWRSDDGEAIHGAELDDLVGVPMPVAGKRMGMRNRKVRRRAKQGRKVDKRVKRRAKEKGWDVNPSVHEKGTSNLYPDLRTPRDRYLELKPDTETGRKAGKRQTRRYQEAPRDGGEEKRVKTMHYRRTIGGGVRLRPRFKSLKPFWLRKLWRP
jgi:hypothetical protein